MRLFISLDDGATWQEIESRKLRVQCYSAYPGDTEPENRDLMLNINEDGITFQVTDDEAEPVSVAATFDYEALRDLIP